METQSIARRLARVEERIADACERSGRSREEVTLIAVSKGFEADAVREAAAAGVRHAGENRVQEAQEKIPRLSDVNVTWHMIGHLQRNKVGPALDLFAIIHSVDSLRLAKAISKRSRHPFPIFIEVNVAREPAKYGFDPDSLPHEFEEIARLPNLEPRGLMTVAPIADDPEEARPVFRRLREMNESLGLPELSMGMTDDFETAIEEGATHVRIGRAIFGERSYP